MMQPVHLRGVSYAFGEGALRRPVLRDLDLDVDPGEVVLLTGPSGSGKTTLLTLIGALRAMQHGSCSVLGQELMGAAEPVRVAMRRRIGFVFQNHNLLGFLTARQNVAMSLEVLPDLTEADRLARAAAALHQPPADFRCKTGQSPARRQADDFQHHAGDTLQMVEPVQANRPDHVGGRTTVMAVGDRFWLVSAMIGVGQFVILGLTDAAQRDAQAVPQTQPLALQVAVHVIIEQLEVPVFVRGDQLADLPQHRFLGRFRQRGVVAGGAGLHHAAGDQLPGAGTAHGCIDIDRHPVSFAIPRERRFIVPRRIGQRRPFAERVAVLHLFLGPVQRGLAEVRVITEDVRQIGSVVATIALHHRRGFHQQDGGGINLGRIESAPCHVIDAPVLHAPNPDVAVGAI